MNKDNWVKHVGFLCKKPEQSFAEFVQHWETLHADLALKLPGLKKYVINPIDRTQYPDSPIDGFAELWFDSVAEADAAFATELGQSVAEDAQGFTSSMTVAYLNEIHKR